MGCSCPPYQPSCGTVLTSPRLTWKIHICRPPLGTWDSLGSGPRVQMGLSKVLGWQIYSSSADMAPSFETVEGWEALARP